MMNFWLRMFGRILLLLGALFVVIGKVFFKEDRIIIGIGITLIIISLAWVIFLCAQLFFHPVPFFAQ